MPSKSWITFFGQKNANSHGSQQKNGNQVEHVNKTIGASKEVSTNKSVLIVSKSVIPLGSKGAKSWHFMGNQTGPRLFQDVDYRAFLGRFRVAVLGGPAGGQRWAEAGNTTRGGWNTLEDVVWFQISKYRA